MLEQLQSEIHHLYNIDFGCEKKSYHISTSREMQGTRHHVEEQVARLLEIARVTQCTWLLYYNFIIHRNHEM